MSLALLERGSR